MKKMILVPLMLCACFLLTANAFAKQTFEMVALEANGTRIWIPSVLVAYEGEEIEIHAVSKVPAPLNAHGLHFPDYKISEVVDEKGKTIKFTAGKPGLYPMKCHMHPAHIGGQLVVLKK